MSAKPFKVQIPQSTLDDLHDRLARTRWTDEIQGAGWNYGANLVYLKELVDYWLTRFDWRMQEESINRFAHFRADVDGLGLHFIHERGQGENPLPIILTHGWPDSFFRFSKIIPLLTDPEAHGGAAADSFDVVAPSLPGYGFSEKPKEPGVTTRIADLWVKLMTKELGYRKFAAHGGDIGGWVTQQLAQSHAESLVGIHLTDVPYLNLLGKIPSDLSETEKKYIAAGEKWGREEGAYAMLQSTKPQTLAQGLNDSPTGLAAWIVEKFRSWSDCGGDVEKRFTKDELLTNITIYWATETINSSFLPYYEAIHSPPPKTAKQRVETPTGFAIFKGLVSAPREWGERFFNVKRWTKAPRGGHFAALEEPELLVEDIRAFFRPLRELNKQWFKSEQS